jgi:gluconokinase
MILSIDIGSSSARSIFFDAHARALRNSLARRPVTPMVTPDGGVTFSADELIDNIFDCIDESLAKVGKQAGEIGAVACDTFVTSLIGIDSQDRPVTPLISYADTRSAPDAHRLQGILDESVVHQRTGCRFHPTYLPPRFLWIQRQHPKWLETCRRWITIGEYLALKLFGETAASYSAASWGGLFNRWQLDWDSELLAVLPIQVDSLSRLVDSDQPFRGLRSPFAKRWAALKDIPWFPAIGDGAAANLGSGCISPNYAAVTMGTSTAVRVTLPGKVETIPSGLWSYFIDREHTLLGGALNEGGNLLDWLQNTLHFEAGQDLEALIESIPLGAHGVTFLPLLAGERSPGWKAEARGILGGISLATTPAAILRAGIEGLAYRIGSILTLLEPYLEGRFAIIASGGALLNSPSTVQILADVLGRPVYPTQAVEPSARGAAMLALRSLGLAPDLDAFGTLLGPDVLPNTANHAAYQEMINRQQKLYQAL